MKNTVSILTVVISLTLMSSICKKEHDKDVAQSVYARWYVNSDNYESHGSSLDGNTISAQCQDNNNIWIKMGSVPTESNIYHVVDYSKSPLDANEMTIDIAHGSKDYLSTGADQVAQMHVNNGKLQIDFTSVHLQGREGAGPIPGDTIVTTGFIVQQ